MTTTPTAPSSEQVVHARTCTPAQQWVRIQVASLIEETADGWLVWGYRITGRSHARLSYYPRHYLVPKAW